MLDDYRLALQWLNNQSKPIQNNLKILSRSERLPYLLHISQNDKIKVMTPRIGERQAKMEDRTVPRICVADTLVGAMIGYASVLWDSQNDNNAYTNKKSHYKGGYYIYAIPFDHCFVPNNKLVYDASMSGEKWLVNYKPGTAEYTPKRIGKVFLKEMVTEISLGKRVLNATFYLETEADLWLSERSLLRKGHYRLHGPMPDQIKTYKGKTLYRVEEIDQKSFNEVRRLTVSLLDFKTPRLTEWK